MPQRTLNLGILAHVDAGKTTLTERLLHAAGVIDEIGSVDAGTTQTDSLALERQRGITIKSAVVSFAIGGVTVNLIDTPGHPDFIAEVERVLSVLDGAVLVISAVEGVQPQTRVLMRALQRLRIPALLFVNKIDRPGAGERRVLQAISARLSPDIVPMGFTHGLGTRAAGFTAWGEQDTAARARLAEVLAERDERILAAYVHDELTVPYGRLRRELVAQTRRALVHPVFFGAAVTGAGVPPLMTGLTELLPAAAGEAGGPVSGRVFKIERGPGGEKVAYVRMFSGTVRKLTPLVLLAALKQAGTVVCEPMIRVGMEIPADAVGSVLVAVARLGGVVATPSLRGDLATLETVLPAARAQVLQRQLPGLTGGEGVADTGFGGYRPVGVRAPARPRTMADPLNHDEYMLQLAGRAAHPVRRRPSSGRAESSHGSS